MSGRPRPTETYRRNWPGWAGWWWEPPRQFQPLANRLVLYLVVLPEIVGNRERLGLGAWRLQTGSTVLEAGLIHADDLEPERVAELEAWAAGNLIRHPRGSRSWCVLPASEFNRRVLIGERPRGERGAGVYRGGAVVVGLDLGHALSLLAAHVQPSKGRRHKGGWSLGMAGLGVYCKRGEQRPDGEVAWRTGWCRAHAHAPRLYLRGAGAVSVVASFENPGSGRGQKEKEKGGRRSPRRGEFIDVCGLAYALDDISSPELGPHLARRGLRPLKVPASVRPDRVGAEVVRTTIDAVRELALRLDQEGAGLDLARLHSPGGVAAQLLGRLGVRPPGDKFKAAVEGSMPDWMGMLHGGWLTSELHGVAFPVADVDARSAYSAVFCLLDGWRHLTAREVREQDETAAARAFLARPDLAAALLDPATWRRWGLTLVEVVPRGDRLPVAVPVERSRFLADQEEGGADAAGDRRLRVGVVTSDSPMPVTIWDAAASAVLTGRAPEVVRATRLVPLGRQGGLRPLRFLGHDFDPAADPAAELVCWRRRIKPTDGLLSALLRVVGSALAWGNPARMDTAWRSNEKGRRRVGLRRGEKPGPWCWPPLAVSVSAGMRLLLALVERRIQDRGGIVAARNTDGALIPASPEGGALRLADGEHRVLSWSELNDVLGAFDRLDPFSDGEAFFDVKREHEDRPLWAVSFSELGRYALFTRGPDGSVHLVDATEQGLGGVFVPPPSARELRDNGRHLWTADVASALAQWMATGGPLRHFRWEAAESGWPAVRRLRATRPRTLDQLHEAGLELRPFGRFLELQAQPASARFVLSLGKHADPVPVAADPGGDLRGWAALEWRDRPTGEQLKVNTGAPDGGLTTSVRRLAKVAEEWGGPPGSGGLRQPPAVCVEASLVRRVGKDSYAVLARAADPADDGRDLEPEPEPPRDGEVIAEAARLVGHRPLGRLLGLAPQTLDNIARVRRPRPDTIARVRRAVRSELGPGNWRELLIGWARQQHDRRPQTCAVPSCDRPPRPQSVTCCEAHRKQLARLRQREAAA